MSLTYVPGSATPGLAGLADFPSLRLGDDGSFRALTLPPIFESPPLRESVTPLGSDNGGRLGTPLMDPWAFELSGWFLFNDETPDIGDYVDYLKDAVNIRRGLQVVEFNLPGWAGPRQMSLRLDGQVQVGLLEKGENNSPERGFVIPVIAPDPLKYATTETVTTIATTATPVVNDGDYPAPFVVRFNGPVTNPQINGPGSAGTNRIKLLNADGTDLVIASGDWIDVYTNPADPDGVRAVDNNGDSVFSVVVNWTAYAIQPGSSNWTKTVDAGAGAVTITHRSAWT